MDCTNPKLLLIDADPASRSFLTDNLTRDGYDVLATAEAAQAGRLLTHASFEMVILDLGVPDGDGLAIARSIRAGGTRADPALPIIALSARDTQLDRLRALDQGCDDFLARPYWYPELRARVRGSLRRQDDRLHAPRSRLRVGPLELDPLARQAWVGGQRLALSSKEFSLLRLLASEPERVYTRVELLRTVWGWEEVGAPPRTRTLDSHACRLRRKLAGEGLEMVINVWGVGYRLTDAGSEIELLAA
jgi:DNA-binding response OmpR family regulator